MTKPSRFKYRIPHRCQNGHFRWLYASITQDPWEPGQTHWGPKEETCRCPCFGMGEGFKAFADPQLSTGRTDAAGVEIYEGDLINDNGNAGPDAFRTGVVVWHADWARWGFVPFLSYPAEWAHELRGSYTVIGNIYEDKSRMDKVKKKWANA